MLLLTLEKRQDIDIIHITCGKTWDSADTRIMTDCVLKNIQKELERVKKENQQVIFLTDCKQGVLPPPSIVLQIITFMLGIGHLIKSSLLCTIMYAKDKEQSFWIEKILQIYKPHKPFHVIHDENLIDNIIVKEKISIV